MKPNLFRSYRFSKSLCAASLALAVLPVGVGAFPAPQWMQGGHSARITGVACSADGAMIVSSSEDGTVKLWSTNGALLRTLTTQACPITALALSPDGTKIAAGGYVTGSAGQGVTYLWQAPGGWTAANVSLVRLSTNSYGYVSALAFTSDSSKLASGCAAGNIFITTVSSGASVTSCTAYNTYVRPAGVTSLAFSSSGGMMASGCEDSTIRVWNSSWTQLWTSTNAASPHTTNVAAVAFSTDGLKLATASFDQTVKIWASSSGTLLKTLTEHTNVASVAFSPDGQKVVVGCVAGTVREWNWANNNLLGTIPADALPVTATLFSPDGARGISGRRWRAACLVGCRWVRPWRVGRPKLLHWRGGYLSRRNAVCQRRRR